MEDELRRALFVNVVGDPPSGGAAVISDALTMRFNLQADALDLRRAAPDGYILFLPMMKKRLHLGLLYVSNLAKK